MELTNGAGADAVLECVGTEQSTDTAMKVWSSGCHRWPGRTTSYAKDGHDSTIL